MTAIVSSEGQIILPAELREQDEIKPGQQFDAERIKNGKYRLTRRPAAPGTGLTDWLLSCPEKGYFVPIESESIDTL